MVAGHTGTVNLGAGGGDTATNLVIDGTFDEATSTTWTGNAYNPVNGVNEANVATAGDAFAVNLSGTVDLTPGATYTLSFDVSGEAGRTIIAGIGQSAAPYNNHTDTVTLSETSQTIVMHLTAKHEGTGADFGDATSRVIFDMGADTGAVNIDNVSLVAGHTGTVNLGAGGGDTSDSGSGTTDYDETVVQHLGDADPSSAVKLSIKNTGADKITVYVESNDSDPVDLVTIGAQASTPAGGTSSMRLADGVAEIDLFWDAGTMPSTTSFEVLWSKVSNGGNWILEQSHIGTIDTSFGATVAQDPETLAEFLAGPDTPTLAAETVLSLYSDVSGYGPNNLDGLAEAGWGGAPAGSVTEMTLDDGNEIKKLDTTTYAGFVPGGTDSVDGYDTLNLSLFLTDASDFEIKLVDLGTNQTGHYYISAGDLTVNDWTTVSIDLTQFNQSDAMTGATMSPTQDIDQIVLKTMSGPQAYYLDDMYFAANPTIIA